MEPHDLTIPAVDGLPLAATVFGPRDRGGSVIVMNSATGVPRGLYRRFASYLVERGYVVVTYDYRGIGGSAPDRLRGFDADLMDWLFLDTTAVVDWVRSELEPARLFLMGHSYGGQVVGMLEDPTGIDGMVTFSSQSAHWRLMGGNMVPMTFLTGYAILPTLSTTFGYAPWSWFAPGEDLPKGVALQWSRWIRKRGYLLDDPTLPLDRYDDFEAPVLAYSFDDDKIGTRQAVDALMLEAYPNVERRHIVPADEGIAEIGHMGFFKRGSASLWPPVADWLDDR